AQLPEPCPGPLVEIVITAGTDNAGPKAAFDIGKLDERRDLKIAVPRPREPAGDFGPRRPGSGWPGALRRGERGCCRPGRVCWLRWRWCGRLGDRAPGHRKSCDNRQR